MRGILLIMVLIAMLVIGILVIKDMKTETAPGVTKEKAIEHAKEGAKAVENALGRIKKTAKGIAGSD